MTETARQHNKEQTDRRRALKRAVRNAIATGGTVPYDIRTLIEAGVSVATIRRVARAS